MSPRPQSSLSGLIPGITLRQNALRDLGIDEAAITQQPQITPELAAIAKTLKRAGQPKVTRRVNITGVVESIKQRVPYGPGADIVQSWPIYLRSSDAPEAQAVLTARLSLSITLRRQLPIEAYCAAASVSSLRILEILVGLIVRRGAQASTIIAAVNQPRVVQKTVEMALTDEGVTDRTNFHKATGFLPMPKGAQTTINIQQSTTASAGGVVVAPTPEATIRTLADRFNADRTKALPPSTAVEMPPPPLVVDVPPGGVPIAHPTDVIDVGIDAGYDDEEETDE
jgi:hypothetical protein